MPDADTEPSGGARARAWLPRLSLRGILRERNIAGDQRPLYRWLGRSVNNTDLHKPVATELAGTRSKRRCASLFCLSSAARLMTAMVQLKKDRVADRPLAPLLRASALHHPSHW